MLEAQRTAANPIQPLKPRTTHTRPKPAPLRPDIGTQAQFRKRKQPARYTYDSSLSPALDWDGQNAARKQGEELIREILEAPTLESARDAARRLQQLSKPFLNWAGKAERLSFDVPSLPLFVHERLSTSAILETLRGHRQDAGQMRMFDLFGDPQHSITDQILKPYEHGPWQNRMILGDSLIVMNSLFQYEGMGGKVQMIYMDPPYGVKFGSNFQPFVRKRDVSHGDDEDMTREPEMVQAYRDTELGLHSYPTWDCNTFPTSSVCARSCSRFSANRSSGEGCAAPAMTSANEGKLNEESRQSFRRALRGNPVQSGSERQLSQGAKSASTLTPFLRRRAMRFVSVRRRLYARHP